MSRADHSRTSRSAHHRSFEGDPLFKMLPFDAHLRPYCLDMATEPAAQPATLPHWPSIERLEESSQTCACCHILLGCAQEKASDAAGRFNKIEVDQMRTLPLMASTGSSTVHTVAAGELRNTRIDVKLCLPNLFHYFFGLEITSLETTCRRCCARSLLVLRTDRRFDSHALLILRGRISRPRQRPE